MVTLSPLALLSLPVRAVAGRALTWSTESQQVARRNALVANTALSARRHDREDVDRWFARSTAPTSASSVSTARR